MLIRSHISTSEEELGTGFAKGWIVTLKLWSTFRIIFGGLNTTRMDSIDLKITNTVLLHCYNFFRVFFHINAVI